MTNYRLSWYSGSDTYLYTLGKEFISRGHKISIYSSSISPILQGYRFQEAGFNVLSQLENKHNKLEKENDYDVIHCQHHDPASEAHSIFSEKPAFFVSHGVLPSQEIPPRDVNFKHYIAVSEEVYEKQFKRFAKASKTIIRNPIDTERFSYAPKKLGKRLKILITSNYFHNEWRAKEVWEAVKELNAEIEVIGTNGRICFNTEKYIAECDIAIGLGRSILEPMSMGKPVIVGDYNGYDGMITDKSYPEIRQCNFSGRRYYKEKWHGKRLVKEIKDIFKGDYIALGKANREIILKHHNVKNIADKFLNIYKS